MARKVLSVRKYKVGYEIRKILFTGEDAFGSDPMVIKSAFTPSGSYIGTSKMAHLLCKKMGIAPELTDESHTVCSIGFCWRNQKWYGWSHRAIVGFGIGDKLFEEYLPGATEDTPFVEHGDVTIETLDQAKQAAVNFAESVS